MCARLCLVETTWTWIMRLVGTPECWEVADGIEIQWKDVFVRETTWFWRFRCWFVTNFDSDHKIMANVHWTKRRFVHIFVQLNLPLIPQSNFIQLPSTARGQRSKEGEDAGPPLHSELELNGWKCCERSAASTVTSALLFVSCLCGVAVDGRVSSRWPLWCHTLWQAVCFCELLAFPSLSLFSFTMFQL